MRVLMSGGGTAGHVNPALAVAALLADARDDVLFVGTPGGLEARLVPEAGLRFVGVPARGFDRSRPLTAVSSAFGIARSTLRCRKLLRRERPDVVVCFGAFVSAPVGLAAASMRVPLVLHEQNSTPGLANRLLARFATVACVTHEESAAYFARARQSRVTGNPVRAEVLEANRERGRETLSVHSDELILLVFGGSRGARHINTALVANATRLLAIGSLRVVHIAGPTEADTVREALQAIPRAEGRWEVHEYLDRMGDVLAAADLVVARAGATSIAELTVQGKPSVLVPYPYATDDHQTLNAKTLVEHGAALLVSDAELDGSRFGDVLVELLGDERVRDTMARASSALGRPDAAARLVDVIRAVADGATISTEDAER